MWILRLVLSPLIAVFWLCGIACYVSGSAFDDAMNFMFDLQRQRENRRAELVWRKWSQEVDAKRGDKKEEGNE